MPSKITNCLIVTRRDADAPETWMTETAHGDGSVFVNLDSYLICPAELVTEEQLKILFPGERDISKLMTFAALKSNK